MLLVAATTVVLNLDTSVAFLTPVLISLARRRGFSELPFVYGCVYMSNAASLLLPGSNLTNLLVFASNPVPGAVFARDMLAGWAAAVVVTALLVPLLFRGGRRRAQPSRSTVAEDRGWLGWLAVAAVVVMILLLPQPALPVLGTGCAAAAVGIVRGRFPLREATRTVNPAVLGGLFALAVGLGTVARLWTAPSRLVASADRVQTAALGAAAALVVNNLPAAVLLSSGQVPHARSLLLGLDLGPSLAVTGSLSAVIWLQAARHAGTTPSVLRYSVAGLVIVPLSIGAGLLAFSLTGSPHL